MSQDRALRTGEDRAPRKTALSQNSFARLTQVKASSPVKGMIVQETSTEG